MNISLTDKYSYAYVITDWDYKSTRI